MAPLSLDRRAIDDDQATEKSNQSRDSFAHMSQSSGSQTRGDFDVERQDGTAHDASCQDHPLPSGVISDLDANMPCRQSGQAQGTHGYDKESRLESTGVPPSPRRRLSVSSCRDLPDVPEGGLAGWLNCIGASVSFMSSFGLVNAYGVFQDYYKQTRLSHENESVIALIGAIQLFMIYFFAPSVGKVFDSHGVFPLMPLGSFCIVFGLMMLSLTQPNQTYQYFLAQAILVGAGCSMVFTPGLALMGHYFRQRRPLAIGLVSAGSSIGAVVYPIMLRRLIPRIGFPWAVRTMAFIALATLTFACAVTRTRLPLRKTTRAELLRAVDLNGFRDVRYCLAAASAFVTFYAIFIPYFYIEQYARSRGMDPNLATYLLPMINAFGVPARTLPAIFAPRVGVVNMMIVLTSIAGIFCLGLWLPSTNSPAIVAFACLYGFFSGPYISLLPAYVGIITPQPVYGARLGTLYIMVAVACLVGTPTGGALLGKAADESHYRHLIGFSGALVLAGSVILVFIWAIEARMMLRRRREKAIADAVAATGDASKAVLPPLSLRDFRF